MKPFKRGVKPLSPYYCKFRVRGRQFMWCTKTPDIVTARRRARDYREAIVTSSFGVASRMKTRSECVTFQEVFECYETLPLKAGEGTRVRCVNEMARVLKASGYHKNERVDVLNARLAIVFQQKGLAAGFSPVSINTYLRSARAVFSRQAMVGYKAMGLVVLRDWVDEFMSVGYLPEPERLPEIPTPAQLLAAHTTTAAVDVHTYRAFLLAAYAGLRAGEVEAARWDWIDDDVLYIGGREFTPKSKRWRAVRIDRTVLELLNRGKRDGELICGSSSEVAVRRRLPAALQAAGFESSTPVHSLRRLYGSQVAMASGLFAAQHALGHASPSTTSKAYARLLSLPAAVGIAPAVGAALPESR